MKCLTNLDTSQVHLILRYKHCQISQLYLKTLNIFKEISKLSKLSVLIDAFSTKQIILCYFYICGRLLCHVNHMIIWVCCYCYCEHFVFPKYTRSANKKITLFFLESDNSLSKFRLIHKNDEDWISKVRT